MGWHAMELERLEEEAEKAKTRIEDLLEEDVMNLLENLIGQYKEEFDNYWHNGVGESLWKYKKLKARIEKLECQQNSKRSRRQSAINEARKLVLRYGIDAYDMIIAMVFNSYEDLLVGKGEDERIDYAHGIANFAEWQVGGAFRV